jgi:MFS family permease
MSTNQPHQEPGGSASPPADGAERQRAFVILFCSLLVIGVGNTSLFSLVPPMAREIGIPDALAGAIFSLSALFWVFASPFWGRLSDRIGRKPVITAGLTAYAVSMAGLALAAQAGLSGWVGWGAAFVLLALARAIFGMFGSATGPAAQAYVADYTHPSERMAEIAALTSAFALGSAAGPALMAMLAAELGLVLPIALTALTAGIAALAVTRFLPAHVPREGEPALDRPVETRRISSLKLAADPRLTGFLIYAVGMSTVTGALAQTYGFFTMDRLDVAGAKAAELAATGYMTGALALLAAQLGLLPRLRMSPRGLMILGALLLAAGVAVQAAASSHGALLASQMLQGLGFGLARPGFSSGASLAVERDVQGAAAGLVVACNGAGFIVAPLIGGVLYQSVHPLATLGVVGVLCVALAVFAWRSRRLRVSGQIQTDVEM